MDLHPPAKPPTHPPNPKNPFSGFFLELANAPANLEDRRRMLLPGRDQQQYTNALQKGHLPFSLFPSLPTFLFVSPKMMSAAK